MKKMNKFNVHDEEVKTQKNTQIYTLAHAVRSKQKIPENTNSANCSPKIKEESKHEVKCTRVRQFRSHLPMNMIVSKMATRKRFNQENEDPASKIDLSVYRKYPLEPPPWRNISRSKKHQQPSKLEKIFSNMKNKRPVLASSSQHNYPTILKGRTTLDHNRVQSLLLNGDPKDCTVMDTPRLEYNYNQLYGGRRRTAETPASVVFLDEDPLSSDMTYNRPVNKDHLKMNSRPPTPDSSPQVVPDVGEFVWNPVIVNPTPKTQLFDCEDTMSLKELCSSPYKDHEDLPSYFDTPEHETSSTSSEHIVTEESIQLTIFAKSGSLSMFDQDYLTRPVQSPNNSWD